VNSAFDWRAYAARILAVEREPASIAVGKLIADYLRVYKIVTIRRSDGRTYEAAANGQNWELRGHKVPMIARFVATGGAAIDWSHGMLGDAEQIITQ